MDKIGVIDFKGQFLAAQLSQYLLLGSATISFLIGFARQDVYLTIYLFLFGVFATFVVTCTRRAIANVRSWYQPGRS